MASLSQLPSELKWELYYKLDAPSAGTLCNTSSEFKEFCQQRPIRIATLVNFYRQSSKPEEACIKLLQYGKDARSVERLEALITLHPDFLNTVGGEYTIALANSLMSAALFQLGSNPMLPVPPSGDPWRMSALSVKDKVPILTRLGESALRLMMRIPLSRAVITQRVWEFLPLDALRGMLYLPFALSEQVLINMLLVATRKRDYDSARELLERGVNPLHPSSLEKRAIPLHTAVADNGEILWLMLHYFPFDPVSLLAFLPPGVTVFKGSAISKYMEGTRETKVSFTAALKLEYPNLLFINSFHRLKFWNDLNFWRLKWVEDIGTEAPMHQDAEMLRQSYRQTITKPLLLCALDKQEVQLRGDREYERGLFTIFQDTSSKISIKKKLVAGFSVNTNWPRLDDTIVGMPDCNYTIKVRGTKIQFDSLIFLDGMIKACRLIELDPFQTLTEFQRVNFDK